MVWPVINLKCEVDEDYVKLLDKCIDEGKKLVDDGAIERTVSYIDEEDFRYGAAAAGNAVFEDVFNSMKTLKESLSALSYAPSGGNFDRSRVSEFDEAIENAELLQSALGWFMDPEKWLNIEPAENIPDDKWNEYFRNFELDPSIKDMFKELLEKTEKFYFE